MGIFFYLFPFAGILASSTNYTALMDFLLGIFIKPKVHTPSLVIIYLSFSVFRLLLTLLERIDMVCVHSYSRFVT